MGLAEDFKIDLSSLMTKMKRMHTNYLLQDSYNIPPEEAEEIEAAIALANPEARGGPNNGYPRVIDFHLWSLGVSNAPSAATADEVQRVRLLRKEEAGRADGRGGGATRD